LWQIIFIHILFLITICIIYIFIFSIAEWLLKHFSPVWISFGFS